MIILVAEDYSSIRRILVERITVIAPGAELLSAQNGQEGLKVAENKKIDLLVTDYNMGPGDGIFLSEELRKLNPDITIFMLSESRYLDTYVKLARANLGFGKLELAGLFAEIERFVVSR